MHIAPNYFYTFYRWNDDDKSVDNILWFCQHLHRQLWIYFAANENVEWICRAWWHCYCFCRCCVAQWMNEYFELCFKFPCAILCSCCSRFFSFVWLSLKFAVTMRNCLIACAVSSLCVLWLFVSPAEAGFARWKRKFSACDNIPIKNHDTACFLRQTRAIKSTSKSEIGIVVTTGYGQHPRLQSHPFLFSSIIYRFDDIFSLRPWHFDKGHFATRYVSRELKR